MRYHQVIELQVIQTNSSCKESLRKEEEVLEPPLYRIQADLALNEKVIAASKNRAGRFVLGRNVLDEQQLTSDEMLNKYKEPQAPEGGFGFLKDPLFFADSVFLKSPARVETMARLMGLCLLVYTLGQRQLRLQLHSCNTGIKNQLGQLTDRPTLRWDT